MQNDTNLIENGCIRDAKKLFSPNQNDRPNRDDIRLIIIHNISLPPEQFDNHCIDDFFLNKLDPDAHPYFRDICQLQVSAHLLIRRNGDITQFVPFHQRAWHAGTSSYKGEDNCNDFSIGIELEGTDDINYTGQQYAVLADCCNLLIDVYPKLSAKTIVGHCDVAPGRKTDPGDSFDWKRFKRLLRQC
ncbi:MAG: 1,6-anhydro-N-acetylmuramyl-L-alanine amidase AmpD [Piscirickettsiaceae bacterium]|nr:MAG: 1,6-anhydro-N-acetylmuramyl-L-alanine amidase AmpD [Piscirickettsiaceae bacterium]